MDENPYDSPECVSSAGQKQSRRRGKLMWSGMFFLAISISCLLGSIVLGAMANQSIANSAANVSPEDFAQRVSFALLLVVVVLPLGILGLVLLLMGLFGGRKVE